MDFSNLIKNYDAETTLFYADPPYVGTENYYKGSLKEGFGIKDY
jgi:DNA adenine methylase